MILQKNEGKDRAKAKLKPQHGYCYYLTNLCTPCSKEQGYTIANFARTEVKANEFTKHSRDEDRDKHK